MSSELESLYKNRPVILWVEDPFTRIWLRHLWQDADIGLLVAGGNDAVHGAVKDAREAGYINVFGFRDRDFGKSNQPAWSVQARDPSVFVPDAHEVENYLLDFQGLAALGPDYNRRKRSSEDLENRTRQRATEGLWWMAVRATITDARNMVTADFPTHPKLGNPVLNTVADAQQELEKCLLESKWGERIREEVPNLNSAWIVRHLAAHDSTLRAQLGDGSWRWFWSGKELFAHVAGYLQCAPPDLAKGLAEHQRAQGTVDSALQELHAVLRKRAGLDSW